MSKESAMAVATGNPIPEASVASTAPLNEVSASEVKSTPFAQLANKEAQLVKTREELKREREMIDSEKEKIKRIKSQYDEYQTTKEKDPVAALKMLGFNETDIFNYMAQNQVEELTPEQKAVKAAEAAADAKIKAFEESQNKKVVEEQQKADQSLIQNYKRDVSKIIQSDADKYEYCSYYGPAAEELIYETVLEVVKQSNGKEVITPQEAADLVEGYYEEQDRQMNKLKKRNPSTQSASPSTQSERTRTVTPGFPDTPQPKPTITRSRTLHNGATSTVASTRHTQNESREQKRDRLMEALRNGS